MMRPAIAAGHELTAGVAYEVMKDGGNAIDAAIAAFFMSFLTEPCMSSAGGGAFANVFTKEGDAFFLDFFCQTPARKLSPKYTSCIPVDLDFGGIIERYFIGHGTSAIPGSLAGAFALHKRFGTIPMKILVQPLIEAATNGVAINNFQYFELQLLKPILEHSDHGKALFFEDGKLRNIGQKVKMPGLADFMDYFASEGPDAFYKGEVAEKLVRSHKENGGHITKKDLENYLPVFRKPFRIPFRNWTVLCNPFPAIGGAFLALFLNHIAQQPVAGKAFGPAYLQQLYDAFKYILPMRKNKSILLGEVAKLWPENIPVGYGQVYNSKLGSTTHLNVADKLGNAVSLTTSIGEGAGYFLEGIDVQMNNMLGELALLPDGLNSWYENCRLSSMMTPTIVLDELGKLKMVAGSAGGSRIPTAIGQVIYNVLDFGLDVQAAVNGPKAHLEHGVFNVENLLGDVAGQLNFEERLNIWKEPSMFFGGAHTLVKSGEGWTAAGDIRRDGVAL